MSNSTSFESRVLSLARPIAEELELEVLELQILAGSPQKVVLFMERRELQETGSGITIAEITRISKTLGYLLEEEEIFSDAYQLEVSSPGVERELKTERDFQRFLNSRVKVVGISPIYKGNYAIEGVLRNATAEVLEIELNKGQNLTLERTMIRRVQNIFDFSKAFGQEKNRRDKNERKKNKTNNKRNTRKTKR